MPVPTARPPGLVIHSDDGGGDGGSGGGLSAFLCYTWVQGQTRAGQAVRVRAFSGVVFYRVPTYTYYCYRVRIYFLVFVSDISGPIFRTVDTVRMSRSTRVHMIHAIWSAHLKTERFPLSSRVFPSREGKHCQEIE